MILHEKEIFQLILNSGDARTYAMKALECARAEAMEDAFHYLERAGKKLNAAHKEQAALIQEEINGEGFPLSLLMVHAQDHLMNSITVRDLAREMVLMKQTDLNRRKEDE